jgi:hypothetical protein
MENPLLFDNCPECGRPNFTRYEEDNCYKCEHEDCGCVIPADDYTQGRISQGDSILTKILKALRLKR